MHVKETGSDQFIEVEVFGKALSGFDFMKPELDDVGGGQGEFPGLISYSTLVQNDGINSVSTDFGSRLDSGRRQQF